MCAWMSLAGRKEDDGEDDDEEECQHGSHDSSCHSRRRGHLLLRHFYKAVRHSHSTANVNSNWSGYTAERDHVIVKRLKTTQGRNILVQTHL